MGAQPRGVFLTVLALYLAGPIVAFAQQPPNPGSPEITTGDFKFNFQPLPDAPNRVDQTQGSYRPYVVCNMPGQTNVQCDPRGQWFWAGNFAEDFTTSFLQEVVTINGIRYFHVIVDQRDQGFGQEFYMRAGGVGGAFGTANYTDSGGAICFPSRTQTPEQAGACLSNNNAADPLRRDAAFTGNGTGNPRHVMMRQTLEEAEKGFTQEFIKPFFETKPIIRQDINDGNINSEFVADMSAIDYSTTDAQANFTNRMTVTSPGFPGGSSASFDVNDNPNPGTNVTAGRYQFDQQRGGFLGGTYTYFDGAIDPVHSIDWSSFRDPAQNQ